MLKKILIIFLLFLALIFTLKDFLLKVGISYFLNQKFSLESRIEKAKLDLRGITLEDFSVTKDDLNLVLKKVRITFDFFNRDIDYLKISNCNLRFKDINASLTLEKSKGGRYVLDVLSLKFKDKEIKDISLYLVINEGLIFINRINTDFLGYSAQISGVLDYQDYKNICLKLNLKDTSFKSVVNLFSKEEDFALAGDFDGRLELCLDRGKISKMEGNFYNTGGGIVNIEKGISLEFLRRYLDKASYDVLVDSFKHYAYNKGRIEVAKEGEVIALDLDFGSDELGQRNILINLHSVSDIP